MHVLPIFEAYHESETTNHQMAGSDRRDWDIVQSG